MRILIIADDTNEYYYRLALEVTQLCLAAGTAITMVSKSELGNGLFDLDDYDDIITEPGLEVVKRLLNRGYTNGD